MPLVVWSVTAQSLSIAFLPSLVRVRQHSGQAAANILIRVMLTRVVIGFALVAGVMTLLSPWLLPLVASGFNDQEIALTSRLFGILIWAVPLTGISGYLGAILNASEAFAVVAIAPITLPLSMFLSVVLLVPHYGIEALAWSVVASYVLELALLCVTMWWHNLPLLPTWQRHEALGHVLRQYGHLSVGAMLMSSTTLVDQSMASWLGPESVSVLNYGNKVVALLVGTIALGLGTAVFPHFSRLAASGDTPAIRKTLRSLVVIVTSLTIPLDRAARAVLSPSGRIIVPPRSGYGRNDLDHRPGAMLLSVASPRLRCRDIGSANAVGFGGRTDAWSNSRDESRRKRGGEPGADEILWNPRHRPVHKLRLFVFDVPDLLPTATPAAHASIPPDGNLSRGRSRVRHPAQLARLP